MFSTQLDFISNVERILFFVFFFFCHKDNITIDEILSRAYETTISRNVI